MKNILKIALITGVVGIMFSACSSKDEISAVDQFGCKQDGVAAPKWTCMPVVENAYAGVGVAQKSKAGIAFMVKEALSNGRSDLAQQIQTQVKDKVENFTRSTGIGDNEVVDKVTTAVSKQVSKVDLLGSKYIDQWTSPKGNLFLLVIVDADIVNKEVKNSVKSSFKNDDALWQQFQSQQSLENLEKEFPTE